MRMLFKECFSILAFVFLVIKAKPLRDSAIRKCQQNKSIEVDIGGVLQINNCDSNGRSICDYLPIYNKDKLQCRKCCEAATTKGKPSAPTKHPQKASSSTPATTAAITDEPLIQDPGKSSKTTPGHRASSSTREPAAQSPPWTIGEIASLFVGLFMLFVIGALLKGYIFRKVQMNDRAGAEIRLKPLDEQENLKGKPDMPIQESASPLLGKSSSDRMSREKFAVSST